MSAVMTPFRTLQAASAMIPKPGAAPWLDPPQVSEYIHNRGSIVCPDAGTTDTVITSYRVQPGYAAVLTYVLFEYRGATDPIQGDATSLYYSLRLDGSLFLRDFAQITTQLGSLTHGPYPIPGAIPLRAGQTVEGLVTVPAASGVATGDPNRVFCHLLGWQWPVR